MAEEVGQPGGGTKNRYEMILGFKEHQMQHCGQLMVLERMLGIIPHLQPVRAKATA